MLEAHANLSADQTVVEDGSTHIRLAPCRRRWSLPSISSTHPSTPRLARRHLTEPVVGTMDSSMSKLGLHHATEHRPPRVRTIINWQGLPGNNVVITGRKPAKQPDARCSSAPASARLGTQSKKLGTVVSLKHLQSNISSLNEAETPRDTSIEVRALFSSSCSTVDSSRFSSISSPPSARSHASDAESHERAEASRRTIVRL